MQMGPLQDIIGRARDWWARDDDVTLGGPVLDPSYNGWYITALPPQDPQESTEDHTRPTDER
jgi:hypothetical protein